MFQELFRIPLINRPVYGFGLMMILGFFIATEFGKFLCRRSKIHPDILMNAALIALISGVIGARLSHVIENWSIYTDSKRSFTANLFDAANISSGGLTFYGGFILGTPITIWYALKKKVPLLLGMDIVAPCLMIGLGFGRIGCFLNGCCYGAECQAPWAVSFPYHSPAYLDEAKDNEYGNVPPPLVLRIGTNRAEVMSKQELQLVQNLHHELQTQPKGEVRARLGHSGSVSGSDLYLDALVDHAEKYGGQDLLSLAGAQRSTPVHPAQLYSAFNAFLIAALLAAYFTLPHVAGRGFALMLMFEGFTRYLLELLRVEPSVVHIGKYGMSLSMVLGLALVACGAIMWIAVGLLSPHERGNSPSLVPTPA